jgi:ribose-phosphate pyrophosphokinase
VDLSKYIALIIDTLNHDLSVSHLLNPVEKIKNKVRKYMESDAASSVNA